MTIAEIKAEIAARRAEQRKSKAQDKIRRLQFKLDEQRRRRLNLTLNRYSLG